MHKRRRLLTSTGILFAAISTGIIAGCSDSIDKSPLTSIPDNAIPAGIQPASSGGKGLQIKGGSVGRNSAILYIRFEDVMYKDNDIWFRLYTNDSVFVFQESLNKVPNNFINAITYAYTVGGLNAGTNYTAWIVMDSERIKTGFTTLSE